MTRHFVVFAPAMTAAQEGAFALNLSGMEWWHYLPGCWLIVDVKGRLDAAKIRDFVEGVDDRLYCGVFRVEPNLNWTTMLAAGDVSSRSREWITTHWTKTAVELPNEPT